MSANVISLKPKVERWANRIRDAHANGVDAIIEVGRQLLQAKADCSHGEWGELTGQTTGKPLLPFSYTTASLLMRIARNQALANNDHGHYLPPSWRTLAILAALDPVDLEAAIADGLIHPEMERKDAEALRNRLTAKAPPRQVTMPLALSEDTAIPAAVADPARRALSKITPSPERAKELAAALRETAELDRMLADARKNCSPQSLAMDAWEPILTAVYRLHRRIEESGDLPECNPSTKYSLIKLWPQIEQFFSSHLE